MLLKGRRHQDERGVITYNNDFDASLVKRVYTIENHSADFIRGWQGHQIEQRWFACVKGSFEISMIKVDNFINPSKDLTIQKYVLLDDVLTYLHIPSGYITAIQATEEDSKLLVFANYNLGEISDEFRYSLEYFTNM